MKPLNIASNTDEVTPITVQTIAEGKSKSVRQLVLLIRERFQIAESEALKTVLELQNQDKMKLAKSRTTSQAFTSYLKTTQALWFWITVATAILTLVVVFIVSEDLLPWSYLRNVLGVIFVLWLPGYAFTKAFFPVTMPIKTSTEGLETIERIVLSLGLSITLVSMVGLILYYSPWGINLEPVVLSLLGLTLTFAIAAVIREYLAKTKM